MGVAAATPKYSPTAEEESSNATRRPSISRQIVAVLCMFWFGFQTIRVFPGYIFLGFGVLSQSPRFKPPGGDKDLTIYLWTFGVIHGLILLIIGFTGIQVSVFFIGLEKGALKNDLGTPKNDSKDQLQDITCICRGKPRFLSTPTMMYLYLFLILILGTIALLVYTLKTPSIFNGVIAPEEIMALNVLAILDITISSILLISVYLVERQTGDINQSKINFLGIP